MSALTRYLHALAGDPTVSPTAFAADAAEIRKIVANEANYVRRNPYVGEGIDGCLRSAHIDESESDQYDQGSEDWYRCRQSAERWRQQAHTVEDA